MLAEQVPADLRRAYRMCPRGSTIRPAEVPGSGLFWPEALADLRLYALHAAVRLQAQGPVRPSWLPAVATVWSRSGS